MALLAALGCVITILLWIMMSLNGGRINDNKTNVQKEET